MAFDYDIMGAANQGAGSQITPEERQMNRTKRLISAAEQTNYDGDPEYYTQIKSLALQAGVPIKAFKTNPFRLAKTGLLSALDSALFGLLPNDMYTPMNEAEKMASTIGGIGGALLPWGLPMRGLRAAGAGLGASKWVSKGAGKKAWDAFLRRDVGSKATKEAAEKLAAGGASGVKAGQQAGKEAVEQITKGTVGGKPPWAPKDIPGEYSRGATKVLDDMVKGTTKTVSTTGKVKPIKPSEKIKAQADEVVKPKVSRKQKKIDKEQGTAQQQKDWKSAAAKDGANIKVTKRGIPKKGSSEEARMKTLMDKTTRKKYNKAKSRPQKKAVLENWIATKGKNWKITVV